MRLADYVVSFLETRGIDHAFTVCGGGSIFLNDALAHAKKLKYICCHHEQAAAMAADAYARVREEFGLAVVTSGPGGTNAITGVAGAWMDHVPTITLSGQSFSTQILTHLHRGFDALRYALQIIFSDPPILPPSIEVLMDHWQGRRLEYLKVPVR